MAEYNPKLVAVVSIRNLVTAIRNGWKDLSNTGNETDDLLRKASLLIGAENNIKAHALWSQELNVYIENVSKLRIILDKIKTRIKEKNAEGIHSVWEQHKEFTKNIATSIAKLQSADYSFMSGKNREELSGLWDLINSNFEKARNIGESTGIQLKMIEQYAPKEMDELTDTILRHMPKHYSQNEAKQYQEEYMKAYEEIKNEASKKKNLWDRFLDILAGGVQQSPAERVMLQRWIEGEKGSL